MPLARAQVQISTIAARPDAVGAGRGGQAGANESDALKSWRLQGRRVACAAGFYNDLASARAVADVLCQRYGLRGDQVAVLRPGSGRRTGRNSQGGTSRGDRRTQVPAQQRLAELGVGGLFGLVGGGLLALLGWLALGHDPAMDVSEPTDWVFPAMLAGGLAGMVGGWWSARQQPRRRFDEAIAGKLATGHSVVVTAGLSPQQELPVLSHLQRTSQSWCAEAPRCDVRL